MVQLPSTVVLLLVALIVSVLTDPRKFRTGLYLLALVVWGSMTAVFGVLSLIQQGLSERAAEWVTIALILTGLVTILVLAGFLIVTGITLIRKEGFAISRLLSFGLGVGMLVYLGLWALVLRFESVRLAAGLLFLGIPLGYLGVGFAAFLLYGWLYPLVAARRGGPVAAVVVLGSGLIRGKVPPLLAARLHRGQVLFEKFPYVSPVLVTSGGKGRDEPVAEASAMADYLVGEGVPRDRLIVENRSRTTEQNLRYSAELLHERGIGGPVAAVTNNFHAFRAALLMRRLGIAGYSVGAPTARYYWPTAVIREFVAVLRDHRVLNIVLLSVCCMPIVAYLIVLLVT